MENTRNSNVAALAGAGTANTGDAWAPERMPPANIEAEQALLGAILFNNNAYERVADLVQAEHFVEAAHQHIYAAATKLIERGQMANAVTLKSYFEADQTLSEVGGASYLGRLQSSVVTIINARDYAQTIHDLYLRRQLIDIGEVMVNEALEYDVDISAKQQIEVTEQRLYTLAEEGITEGGLLPFGKAVTEAVTSAEAAFKRDGHVAGVPSGFKDLDKMLGGLHPSDLIIVAARPSMGKTALATNIAYNTAVSTRPERDEHGNLVERPETVAFFSLEMSAEQLAARILSEMSNVRSDAMRRGEIKDSEFEVLFEASRTLQDLRLFIDDTPALTVSAMRTRARRLKRQHGLSLIVVDYLQLMSSSGGNRNDGRVQEVSEITRGLKAVAKELNVPVIALSQLSRQTEQREDKRPQLSDLRESGSIEQDADVVMFIYREEYYLSRERPSQRANETGERFHERQANYEGLLERSRNLAEIMIAKQRHGPIGNVTLRFDGEFTRFSDYVDDHRLPDAH